MHTHTQDCLAHSQSHTAAELPHLQNAHSVLSCIAHSHSLKTITLTHAPHIHTPTQHCHAHLQPHTAAELLYSHHICTLALRIAMHIHACTHTRTPNFTLTHCVRESTATGSANSQNSHNMIARIARIAKTAKIAMHTCTRKKTKPLSYMHTHTQNWHRRSAHSCTHNEMNTLRAFKACELVFILVIFFGFLKIKLVASPEGLTLLVVRT